MKKYRRSFWAASCVNSMIIPWIVAFVFSYLSVRYFESTFFLWIDIWGYSNFSHFGLFLRVGVLCYLVR